MQFDSNKLHAAEAPSRLALFLALVALFSSNCTIFAQEKTGPDAPAKPAAKPTAKPVVQQRLIDRLPFDEVTLKQGGKRLEVMTLQLPQRPLRNIPAEGNLIVRLLDRPTEEFEVSWSNVARVRIFEELLLDEARRLTAAGNFDDAYDYYGRLLVQYPSLAGLNNSVSDYLRQNALALYKANQHDRAIAVLITLHERDPKYDGLAAAVETIASEIIQGYLRGGNYAAARTTLELWQTRFPGLAAGAAAQWQSRFETAATRQVEDAIRQLQAKNYIAARRAIAKAAAIWPKLSTVANVNAQIEREFPFVNVGVLEASPREPKHRLDCWPALRTGRLTQRLLSEEVDFGAEGGVYQSPYGKFQIDESGRRLTLALSSANVVGQAVTPDSLARFLLTVALPGQPWYRPDFAQLLNGIAIEPAALELQFNRVYVRPEALLQVPPPGSKPRFEISEQGDGQVVFSAPAGSAPSGGLRAIVEQKLPDDEAAVDAIVSGEIDVLDRVPPWQVERLRGVKGIRVGTYRLPTVHVLIPNTKGLLLAKREFRRALCFGIDRKWIVSSVLLGGKSQTGFDVLSGPFPSGLSISDPIRYGYNNRINPRSYEPRLAAILATIGWASANNPTGKKEDAPKDLPEMRELNLAHPNDPLARIACQSIQMQLERAGIRVKLTEFSSDELLAGKVEYDLRYAELAVWEPLVDARSILGEHGLAGDVPSGAMQAALRQLDQASNWNDVRARLADIHDITHHELPVIPLWQTVNYFAHRDTLRGIGESPVALYQNIESWSFAADQNVASFERTAP